MARRKYGTGSVFYETSRDRWCALVDISDENGRRRKRIVRKTREAVEAALDEWWAEHPRTGPSLDGRAVHMEAARARGSHTSAEWYAKVRTYGGLCHYCKRSTAHILHKDHVVPISRGGSDGIDNLVPACADCNQAKGTATAEEFILWAEATGFYARRRRVRGDRWADVPYWELPPLRQEMYWEEKRRRGRR